MKKSKKGLVKGVVLAVAVITLSSCGKEVTNVSELQQIQPPNPYDIVEIVDPCGDAPGIYDEVLLRLQNGQLLASFSGRPRRHNARFALIPAGSYVTTDGSNCHFSVNPDGSIND